MKIGTKKALGIITDNKDRYEQILDKLPFDVLDGVYVIESGNGDYTKDVDNLKVLKSNNKNKGNLRNELVSAIIEEGNEHIFILDDSVCIEDSNVFDAYINTARNFGLWGSLTYAWNTKTNYTTDGMFRIKNAISHEDGDLIFTHDIVDGFSYYHKSIFENNKIGMFGEKYITDMCKLDHYLKLSTNKMSSYFWWFTDIEQSPLMLSDIGETRTDPIFSKELSEENTKHDVEIFRENHNLSIKNIPQATERQVLRRIDYLVDRYSC